MAFLTKSPHKASPRPWRLASRWLALTIALAASVLCSVGLYAQTVVALSPFLAGPFVDSTGAPVASGCLFTYQAGGVVPLATYTDSTGSTANSTPVALNGGGFPINASGSIVGIWLGPQKYKLALYTAGGSNCATGTLIWSIDNVAGANYLTSPVINGTPSGTGLPTIAIKKGSGAGNYSSPSTSYVRVDSTKLAYTVTVPTGWKLMIHACGAAGQDTAVVGMNVALADGSADNSGILLEAAVYVPAATNVVPFALDWVVTGDGASHTINLQYKTANGADAALISNSSAVNLPTMTFLLTPSN